MSLYFIISVAYYSPFFPRKDGVFDHKSYTEKSLSRLNKAKAKSERAAARQAALQQQAAHSMLAAAIGGSSSIVPTNPSTPAANSEAATPAESVADAAEDAVLPGPLAPGAATAGSSAPDRTELLKSKKEVVGRFMQLMVPILIDVYAASVITTVRIKTLTGLLKAISFLDGEEAQNVLTVGIFSVLFPYSGVAYILVQHVPVASFASSILSSKDHPTLVIGALQLVELLLIKVPDEYRAAFRREGVFHEMETLASRTLLTSKSKEKEKDKDKDGSSDSTSAPAGGSENQSANAASASTPTAAPTLPTSVPIPISAALAASMPGFKKLSSMSLDPEDAVTLRARVIKFKYLSGKDNRDADDVFSVLRKLVERIGEEGKDRDVVMGETGGAEREKEKDMMGALKELAALFASANTAVSSFELLQSGVIDALLLFATDKERSCKSFRILV